MDFAPNDVVAARLRDAREAAGLDQYELADAAGVTQPAVSAWEAGLALPKRERWAPLAAALKTTIEDLFYVTRTRQARG